MILFLALFSGLVIADQFPEKYYVDQFCDGKGATEVRLSSGKYVDCLTYGYAIEFGFAKSAWKEDISQAIHYAYQATYDYGYNHNPMVVVIVLSSRDCKNLLLLYNMRLVITPKVEIIQVGPWANKCE